MPKSRAVMSARAALLCWLVLWPIAQALAQVLLPQTADVEALIEALRPLPATRGFGPQPPKASAAVPVEFDPGSVRLTEQGRHVLDKLGAALTSSELNAYAFRVEVHVEASSNPARDLLLSKRQANTIKDYLVKQFRLSPRRLTTGGRGSSQPLDEANRASPLNRRMVVTNAGTHP